KRTYVAVLAITCDVLLSSCSDNSTEPNVDDIGDPVVIQDIDYVKRKYDRLADADVWATDLTLLPVTNFELFLDDKNALNDIADGAAKAFAFMNAATSQTDSTDVY